MAQYKDKYEIEDKLLQKNHKIKIFDNEIEIFIYNHNYKDVPYGCKMLPSTRTELIKKLIRKKTGDVFELNGIKYYIKNIVENFDN